MSEPGANGVGSTAPPAKPHEGVVRHLVADLWAVVRQRCPSCRKGRMFRGSLTMNDPCPVCGMIFQREEGYFLGAMYVSYLLSSVLMISFYFTLAALFPDWNSQVLPLVAVALYLPFVPAVFRYSRVIWVYFERAGCPGDVSAGPYEKVRRQQIAARQSASRNGAAPGVEARGRRGL